MLKLKSTLIAGLVAFIATAGLAERSAHAGGPEGHGAGKLERACQRLTCTADQKAKIGAIGKGMRDKNEPDRAALGKLREDLAAEVAKARPDAQAVKRISAEMERHQGAIRERRMAALLEVQALLNPEQRKVLGEMIARRGPGAVLGGKGGERGKGGHASKGRKGERGEGERGGGRARGERGAG